MNPDPSIPQSDRLEAALAAQLARALHAGAPSLPHDVAERLRAGREQALARRGRAQVQLRPAPARGVAASLPLVASGGTLGWGRMGRPGWWERIGPLLPLGVLLAGLYWVSDLTLQQQVRATAEIDAVLLTDELPPAAYADPGFAEFLRSPEP